jgi:hypothetical protein
MPPDLILKNMRMDSAAERGTRHGKISEPRHSAMNDP